MGMRVSLRAPSARRGVMVVAVIMGRRFPRQSAKSAAVKKLPRSHQRDRATARHMLRDPLAVDVLRDERVGEGRRETEE